LFHCLIKKVKEETVRYTIIYLICVQHISHVVKIMVFCMHHLIELVLMIKILI
jgi:hypothetical protein